MKITIDTTAILNRAARSTGFALGYLEAKCQAAKAKAPTPKSLREQFIEGRISAQQSGNPAELFELADEVAKRALES